MFAYCSKQTFLSFQQVTSEEIQLSSLVALVTPGRL